MLHYLAIDIGGSKTKFIVSTSELKDVHTVETEGFGFSIDSEDDLPRFRQVLHSIDDKFNVCSVAVNLGGKNKNQIYKIVSDVFSGVKVKVFRESEGLASVAFGKSCGADAVLLAGTGTIVTAFSPDGRCIIGGGWGMNIGDGGSGYYIGLEAIRRSLFALDNTRPLTELQKEITGLAAPILPSDDAEKVCAIRDEVRGRIFPLERKRVASFAKTVAAHCQNGEEDALAIMADAGIEMAKIVANSANKLLPHRVQKVAVSGGLVKVNDYWKDEFEKTVSSTCSINQFVYDADGVMLGTKIIASENNNMEV